MGRDPRSEDDAEQPLDIGTAIRAAKTAATLGRAPTPQATAKIGAFDLETALAKSREDDASTISPPEGADPEHLPDPPVHAEAPPVAGTVAAATDAVPPEPDAPPPAAPQIFSVPPPNDLYRPSETSDVSTPRQTFIFLALFVIALVAVVWMLRQ